MNALKIRKRKEYALVFTNGKKIIGKNLILQYLKANTENPRFGITASKKIGNAVKRNYVKRRIRSLINKTLSQSNISLKNYVIVAKKGSLSVKFNDLYDELKLLFNKVDS